MDYINRFKNVALLGSAGKMGSGILLLTAVEMTNQRLKKENKNETFSLYAIDVSDKALQGLIPYVRSQVTKVAEKSIVKLRQAYADDPSVIENSEVIEKYVNDVVAVIRPTTRIESAYEASLVFEAVNENPDLKIKLFQQIDKNSNTTPWYFTNTSSVPIHYLNDQAGLQGRIIGFHFYNPPAVQKLVEMIPGAETLEEMQQFATAYAAALKKVVVPANDIAGFIGNGHFMRDALYGIAEAERLSREKDLLKGIYAIDKVTRDFLIRPMGIFQLIDYVGIDVVRYILQVMNPYFKEDLHSALLDRFHEKGIKGGQNPDGTQKDGFLKYEKGRPVAGYDPDSDRYVAFEEFAAAEDKSLGALPDEWMPWKKLVKSRNRNHTLSHYFHALKKMDAEGSTLAIEYGRKSKDIARQLVKQKVAHNDEDVNTVLMTGFFHAYGPINKYFD